MPIIVTARVFQDHDITFKRQMSAIWDGGVFTKRLNWIPGVYFLYLCQIASIGLSFLERQPQSRNDKFRSLSYTYRIRIHTPSRTRTAHLSHTCPTQIAHGSHTDRTHVAYGSHIYRTHRTHFWLSLRHSAMTSVLFQVRRLKFVLQTCLTGSLNSRDTGCTWYWMCKYAFNVHLQFTIYPCLAKTHYNQYMTERWRLPLILFSFTISRIAIWKIFDSKQGIEEVNNNHCETIQDRRWGVTPVNVNVYKQCY